jgi:hypothetical protein
MFEVAVLAGGILYAGLVLMTYSVDGPHYRLPVDWRNPGRSIQRVLVWLGAKAVALVVRVAVLTYGMLCEASAEVGEWYLRRHAPETQAWFRSRFMG